MDEAKAYTGEGQAYPAPEKNLLADAHVGYGPSATIRQVALESRTRARHAQRDGEIADRVLAFIGAHPDVAQFIDDLRALSILR